MKVIEARISADSFDSAKREAVITVLEEGPGNKSRACWYGPEAIHSGEKIFPGSQVYADHPAASEQADLPERSIRDLVGRIKECWVERSATNGKLQLKGRLKVMEGEKFDWVCSLIKESIQAKSEGFRPTAQVSIHADGDTEPRLIEGNRYSYVKNIKSAVSIDIVTKGGITSSGFDSFLESYFGGNKSMDKEKQLFERLTAKMSESLTPEEGQFLESYLTRMREDGQEDENFEDEQDYSTDQDEDFELNPDNVLQMEDGSLLALTGETDDYGNPIGVDENGEVYALTDDEDDYAVGEPHTMESDRHVANDEEIPVSELVTRYPWLAHEIDQEENGMMESDRDIDIVNLKMENKLLKSKDIAVAKIRESGMDGIVMVPELLGKSPEEMDVVIQARQNLFNQVVKVVESRAVAAAPANLRESANTSRSAGVGQRLFARALRNY